VSTPATDSDKFVINGDERYALAVGMTLAETTAKREFATPAAAGRWLEDNSREVARCLGEITVQPQWGYDPEAARRLLSTPGMQRCMNPRNLDDVVCCYTGCPEHGADSTERSNEMCGLPDCNCATKTHLRIPVEARATLERNFGRKINSVEDIAVGLAAQDAELKKLHAREMQAVGQRLAAERRERESAEEEEYHRDFERRFGEPSPFRGASTVDAERREIAALHKIPVEQVI
jgi:hypothetical protein